MAKATRLPASSERNKDKRRLHLREITEDPHAQLDSVGATLRAARLNRGADPDHIAQALKMKREHVEAIEDNDFGRLPGRTYAIGFVRAYARYVGLDAEVMVQRFKEESAGREHDRSVELVFPDAPEEKRAANGSLILVALVITAAIAGAYYVSMPKPHGTTVAAAPAVEPAVVVNEPAPPPEAAPSAPGSLTQPAGDASPTAPTDTPPSLTAPAITAPPAAATATPAPTGRVFGSENAKSRIALLATAETYVLVREPGPDGRVTLFDRTLAAGESYRAPDKPGVTLVTGNAGGIDIQIDGKTVGTLGKSGETLRNIPIDASYFVERFASGGAPKPAAPAPSHTPSHASAPPATTPAHVAATPSPSSAPPQPVAAAPPSATPPASAAATPPPVPAPTGTSQ